MKGTRRDALERELLALYRSDRDLLLTEEGSSRRSKLIEECVRACESELTLEGNVTSPHMQLGGFLCAQVRFTRPVVWAAFALVALLTVVASHLETDGPLGSQALSAAGGMTALVCLASVTRSKPFGMGELEAACPFNAVSVAVARLLLMGLASALVLATGAVASGIEGTGVVRALLLMGAPYLIACAGGLMCARLVSSPDARGAAISWASAVTVVGAMLFYAAPSAYAQTSVWVWALACAVAGAWCAREVRSWVGASATGFIPEPRRMPLWK